MKNLTIVIVITILSSFFRCTGSEEISGNNKKNDYPECFQNTIDYILQSAPKSPRSTIEKYSYNGEMAYVVFINGRSDEEMAVVTENCEAICKSGGFTGENTCVNWENAEHLETVWKDNR